MEASAIGLAPRAGALWVILLGACATAPAPSPKPPDDPDVRMGTLEISAKGTPEGGLVFGHRDAQSVFDEAGAAQRRGKYAKAIELYRLQLRRFSTPELDLAARYNLGMALEDTGQCPEALKVYARVLATARSDVDVRDTLFRQAGCLREIGQAAQALVPLRRIVEMPATPPLARYEALVRSGEVHGDLEHLDLAEDAFRLIITRARRRPGGARQGPDDEPILQRGPLLARAHLGQAQVLRRRFQLLPLRLPLSVMETDVATKIAAFKRAQSSFLRAIRQGVPGITSAAGLELGEMYEGICEDLLEAPYPAEFTAEEVAVYYEELMKEALPLLDEAVYVYEQNLGVAARLGASNRFVDETRRRLGELKGLLQAIDRQAPDALEAIRRFLALKPTDRLAAPGQATTAEKGETTVKPLAPAAPIPAPPLTPPARPKDAAPTTR